LKHLAEIFLFLLDFAKLGDQKAEFLLSIQAITTCEEFLSIQKYVATQPQIQNSRINI
jgi:hypothetical protein